MKRTVTITRRALVWQAPQAGDYQWDPYTGGHCRADTPGGYRSYEKRFETIEEAGKSFDGEKPGSGVVVKTTTEVFENEDLKSCR